MTWDIERELDENGVENIYSFEIENPDVRYHVYRIDKAQSLIEYIPKPMDQFPLQKIKLEGFSKLPSEFAETGYILGGVHYYLGKKLIEAKAISLLISKTQTDSIRKNREKPNCRMVLNYDSFKKLKNTLTSISTASKQDKSAFVDNFFHDLFPLQFRKNDLSGRIRAKRLISYLDESTIKFLQPSDIEKLLTYLEILLQSKYVKALHRRKLLSAAKIKVDEVALSDVINVFEQMLNGDQSESFWGDFLKNNLFLVESKYIKIIPQLNVVLGSARKVDFALVDTQGYLDLFEIKKPTTQILARSQDRGNYYWSTDSTKALVQAEKYLFHAERKASSLAEDVNREIGISVKVVRPRAVVVLGNSRQLDNTQKQEDFRILRMSMKNIEIVLYDELLDRLKNQRSKAYLDADT